MVEFPIKVAVGTKTGISIDVHFGHARQFLIYELRPDSCQLLEAREVDHYCHGQHGSDSAMQKILFTIKDCHAVFSAMIDDGPKSKLAAIGVQSVSDFGHEAIEASIIHYAQALAKKAAS